MVIFSIICLVVIMFAIQHLLSWFWRKNYKDEYLLGVGFVLSIFSIVVTYIILYTIILWGKHLI